MFRNSVVASTDDKHRITRLFQKRVMRTKFDIYVVIDIMVVIQRKKDIQCHIENHKKQLMSFSKLQRNKIIIQSTEVE